MIWTTYSIVFPCITSNTGNSFFIRGVDRPTFLSSTKKCIFVLHKVFRVLYTNLLKYFSPFQLGFITITWTLFHLLTDIICHAIFFYFYVWKIILIYSTCLTFSVLLFSLLSNVFLYSHGVCMLYYVKDRSHAEANRMVTFLKVIWITKLHYYPQIHSTIFCRCIKHPDHTGPPKQVNAYNLKYIQSTFTYFWNHINAYKLQYKRPTFAYRFWN